MPATLAPVSLRLTPEEYFDWEETQEEKHEYIHGEVFSTSGATSTYDDIAFTIAVALRLVFWDITSQVFVSDMRVQIGPNGRYTYPDLSVVREEAVFTSTKETTLVSPALVVEVLSDSTEGSVALASVGTEITLDDLCAGTAL